MAEHMAMLRLRIAVLSTGVACGMLALVSCTRPAEKTEFPGAVTAASSSREMKMRLVVHEAIRQAQDPDDKAAFEAGQVFVNIEGLDMPVVGVTLPVGNTGKRVHVSFTEEYFHATPVTILAKDALRDFARAKAGEQTQRQPGK